MEEKKAGLKYFLFIGIPVLIVLVVLGCYYHATNPMTILKRTINSSYELLEKNLSKSNVEIEDNFSINGNLKFKTNAELGELSELQNYNYDFNINYNSKEEIMKFTLGMNDKEKDIIHANLYQIKEKQYIELPKIFEYLLEIDASDYNNIWNQTEWNYDSEDIKIIIQKIKDAFLNSLDENYIEREKTDIKINDATVKTTKISYLLDEENHKRTLEYIINHLTEDDTFKETVSKIGNISEEEVIKQLEEIQKNYKYTDEEKINIFTEGLNQNVIRISFVSNNKNVLTYINYQNEISLEIEDWFITINELTEEEIDFNYSNKIEKINGKIKMTNNDTKTNVFMEINTSETNTYIDLELSIKTDEKIEIPDTSNAKKIDQLTNEEQLKIFENLENVLKDTFFYDLIEQNIL